MSLLGSKTLIKWDVVTVVWMDGPKKNTLSIARKGDLGGHETLPKKQCTIFEGNHSKLLQNSALSLIPPVSIGWSKEMRRLKTFNS